MPYGKVQTTRRFILLFLPFAILFSLAFFLFFEYQAQTLREETAHNERYIDELVARTIKGELDSVLSDLHFLSEQNELQDLFTRNSPVERARLAHDFVTFAQRRQRYDQIRYINAKGMEVVRINYKNGKPEIVPQPALENKAKRYYFIRTMQLGDHAVYISPFDLNIEHGEVEEPRKPTLRFALPVFDQQGRKRGILIINYLGKRLLDDLRTIAHTAHGNIWLLNHEGYWLLGPTHEDEWSFMYPNKPLRRLDISHPKLWQAIAKHRQGSLEQGNTVYLYENITPLNVSHPNMTGRLREQVHSPGSEHAFQEIYSSDFPWIIVTRLSGSELIANSGLFRNLIWLYILLIVLLLLTALGAWRLARSLLRSKKAEADAEENRQLWQVFLEYSPSAVYIKDLEGRFIQINRYCEKIIQHPSHEILGKTVTDLYGWQFAEILIKHDQQVIDTGKPVVAEEFAPIDGKQHTFISVKFPLRDTKGKLYAIGAISTDITDRKQTEDALRASEEKFRALLESAPDGIVILDHRGRITLANTQSQKIFELSDGEMQDKPFSLYVPGYETLRAMEDIDVATGTEVKRTRLTGNRGQEKFAIDASLRPLRLGQQQLCILIFRDISERLKLETQLRQSHKMEAIGQLTGGIAHDFNNILGIIVGHLELAEQLCQNDLSLKHRIDTALGAALRGADLTQRLLSFSRQQAMHPEYINISQTIENMLSMLSRTLGADIRIDTRLAAELPGCLLDKNEFENAVLNLAINARDAMPRGGILSFTTEACPETDPENNLAQLNNADSDVLARYYVCLEISDTGKGIARQHLERVFEPFFTTKPPEKGTGLGLSMVYGFVKQSGGETHIYSEEGHGTSIRIYLPAVAHAAASASLHTPSAGVPTGTECILIVDDEPELLEAAETWLKELGYRVLTAPDADTAMAMLENIPGIDLLFTDVVLPGTMNGIALAEHVGSHYPTIRRLLASGFPRQTLETRNATPITTPILRKPYRKLKLAHEIRRLLDTPTHPSATSAAK